MSPAEVMFWDAVDAIRERDPAYRREAFGFVVAALGVAVESLPDDRRRDPARRHLSGAELVAGVIALARTEFGVMAPTVFREWGVLSADDLGRIVFGLVEAGQLSARPEDTIEDFRGGPELLEALARDPGNGAGAPRGRRGSRPRGPIADTP
jgi:uncharacterized repeat protein (TIGR04138 family)